MLFNWQKRDFELLSLKENLITTSSQPEILLYGLFRKDVKIPQSVFFCEGVEPKREVKPFNLQDELGVLNEATLNLYAIELRDLPNNTDIYLRNLLGSLAERGAIFSWLMFDFVFDFENLLTTSIAHEIYGIKFTNEESQLALTGEIRCSNEWCKAVARARSQLISRNCIRG